MKAGFAKTMVTGALVGMAAGMMMLPELDHGTKRRIRKTGRMVRSRAEDMYDGIKNWMR
jgi:gas vesicle protein